MKNSMIGGQSSTGPKIDIKNTTAVKCEECECEYFVQAT